tara:strand:- start:1374 stop:1805 length:432 start_codon:yes stop_codon:yes gene_type:complete
MREDLIGAIKNAMEHGSTPQQAAKSLINSGYDPNQVNEALNLISQGALANLSQKPSQVPEPREGPSLQNYLKKIIPETKNIPPQNKTQRPLPTQKSQIPNKSLQKPKGKKWMKTAILISILVLLVGALALTIAFKSDILNIFG